MPFEIVRQDITNMAADAIVNTANPKPMVGAGTDAQIHQKAGPGLLAARQRIGDIAVGCAAVTPAFGLQAKYVIHTVGPVWHGGMCGEAKALRSCYDQSLKLAAARGCKSIAFPLISTGHYGFPKDLALQIAIAAFSSFLLEQEMQIWLVVFDSTAYQLSEKLFQGVAAYIDENYVAAQKLAPRESSRRIFRSTETCESYAMPPPPAPAVAAKKALSLEQLLQQADVGFTERLLQLIDESGKKDSEIYKKALLSKQHFSKIRNNPHYKPTKATAVALALALELDLEATKDLIGRAGYALTNSSKFDLIIRYHIENKKYNLVEINCVLFQYDQSLLGS